MRRLLPLFHGRSDPESRPPSARMAPRRGDERGASGGEQDVPEAPLGYRARPSAQNGLLSRGWRGSYMMIREKAKVSKVRRGGVRTGRDVVVSRGGAVSVLRILAAP